MSGLELKRRLNNRMKCFSGVSGLSIAVGLWRPGARQLQAARPPLRLTHDTKQRGGRPVSCERAERALAAAGSGNRDGCGTLSPSRGFAVICVGFISDGLCLWGGNLPISISELRGVSNRKCFNQKFQRALAHLGIVL